MTVVIVIQVVMAGLAAGLLLERWAHRDEYAPAMLRDDESPTIEFHPELIVRWDDEADYTRRVRCARRSSVDRRVHVRPQATTSRPYLHTR